MLIKKKCLIQLSEKNIKISKLKNQGSRIQNDRAFRKQNIFFVKKRREASFISRKVLQNSISKKSQEKHFRVKSWQKGQRISKSIDHSSQSSCSLRLKKTDKFSLFRKFFVSFKDHESLFSVLSPPKSQGVILTTILN